MAEQKHGFHCFFFTPINWSYGTLLITGRGQWGKFKGYRCAVDGRNPANQLRLVVYPIIYRVLSFIHPRWLFGLSSINSMTPFNP